MGVNPKRGVGPSARPLLKSDIEAAQANTENGHAAARYLHVNYSTYKKYAQLYGLLDRHKNPSGRGVSRRKIKGLFGLDSILRGEHPTYDRHKLKERMIRAGYLNEECALCGYDKRRVIDGRVPLMLNSKDGNPSNLTRENLELLCYNCTFQTSGYISMKHLLNPGVYEHDQITVGELTDADIAELQDELVNLNSTHVDGEEDEG